MVDVEENNMVTPMMMTINTGVDIDVGVAKNTQARADEEIDNHFAEQPYVEGFEKILKELSEVYSKCLTNFKITLALFPENAKLAELKKNYGNFFKMFGESSPISKSLCIGNAAEKAREEIVPSYSLGLSQMFPKYLGTYMDGCAGSIVIVDGRINGDKELTKNKKEGEKMGNAKQVCLRPRRGIMPALVCRSPYVSRVIDVNAHTISIEEKNVWEWLFKNKRNKKENLFEWKGRGCTKAHFQSLRDNKMVESTVIDTWSHILNENEILRSDASPLRLFLTSKTTVEDGDSDGKMNRYVVFDDNMELVLQLVNEVHNKQYDVKDFDMFVFPVFDAAHHYIICYNKKKPQWEIIENRVMTLGFNETYGDLPFRLHHFLKKSRLLA